MKVKKVYDDKNKQPNLMARHDAAYCVFIWMSTTVKSKHEHGWKEKDISRFLTAK